MVGVSYSCFMHAPYSDTSHNRASQCRLEALLECPILGIWGFSWETSLYSFLSSGCITWMAPNGAEDGFANLAAREDGSWRIAPRPHGSSRPLIELSDQIRCIG